jgi:hypothetical protein
MSAVKRSLVKVHMLSALLVAQQLTCRQLWSLAAVAPHQLTASSTQYLQPQHNAAINQSPAHGVVPMPTIHAPCDHRKHYSQHHTVQG